MGNSSSKSAKIDEIVSVLGDKSDNTSERETTSTWYRRGVEITDVYDVIEILGHGHMGEVFTVRRKTTGHHTDVTKERREAAEEAEKEAGEKKNKRATLVRKFSDGAVSLGSSPGSMKKAHSARIGRATRKSEPPRTMQLGGDVGASPRTGRMSRGMEKVKDKVKKKMGHGGEGNDDDADGDLKKHLDLDDAPSLVHEPPALTAKPAKGIMKTDTPPQSNHKVTPSDMSIELGFIGSDMSKLSMDRILSTDTTTTGATLNTGATLDTSGHKRSNTRKGVHFQRTFAVKTILTSRVNKEQVQELVNEIQIMRKLDHPYVLKLYEVYHVKRKIWLVTELCKGGDLSTRKLSEHGTKNVLEQILRALVYLHRLGVVHRDLKLENVLYENHSKDASIRLIDFGLSRTFDRTNVLHDYSRTPYTMSPEMASGNAKEGHTDKGDVWALGVMAWVLLSGEFPFIKGTADLKDKEKMEALKKAKIHFGVTWRGRGISQKAKEFCSGCLQQDPEQRWTAKQALEHIQNDWGPEVDKVWEAWQAEVKKMKKPEFVSAEDVIDLEEEEKDDEAVATAAAAQAANGEDADEEDLGLTTLTPADAQARAQRIKKHVTKVVQKTKQEESMRQLEVEEKNNIDVMSEIERYTQFGFLKKKILITMANTMDRSEVSKLREWFLNADTMDTGTITLQELIAAFKKVTPDADDSKVEVLFRGIDRDQTGHIHYAEFLAALSESHGLVTMDRLAEAFDRIDTEGKGYITHENLKEMLGSDYDKVTVDKMIEEGDFKKNNQIDYEELLHYMFSYPVKGDKIVGHVTAETLRQSMMVEESDH